MKLKAYFKLKCMKKDLQPKSIDQVPNQQMLEMEVQPTHMTFRPHHIDFS